MFIFMIILFVIGYACIALENTIKINKTATALMLGVLLWVCAIIGGESILITTDSLQDFLMANPGSHFSDWISHNQLIESLGDVSEILFFLLGAMTIVELVDIHGGFKIITDKIKTNNKVTLLWIITLFAFFLSAVLDNLTTAIVVVSLLRKLIYDTKERWFFSSIVIIAANAGGAWSPIGDVTTLMVWNANRITTLNIIEMTFFASFVSILVPLILLSFTLKGKVERPRLSETSAEYQSPYGSLFLVMGIGFLLFVPVFKAITNLPAYLGMLLGLSILWITSEITSRKMPQANRERFTITKILSRIDVSSILFFLGILLAVKALGTVGHLAKLSQELDTIPLVEPSKYYVINILIGIVSSVIDNVPLVAAALGMYNFPCDHYFWEFLCYCAGTGGSILIIGSAAGVAIMGLEKIDFMWYLKKITWIALLGYLAGCGAYILEQNIRTKLNSKHNTTEAFIYKINAQQNTFDLASFEMPKEC